ncbi:thiamine pyrophosphate-dependent acetolactate synthase large subunit-like protein [Sagittula marina]|uniref:Thiamine pyrophosphate-dependent acetolactate synthase large subunit-like protein n=1 Tax=Sagittula marina TaxID=943940 RepID=A0A7W6DNS2_9RHOB|nr:thiamine pyrophosphate-binding protein [Sagittula marina]MBB3986485.1 thiamine pyrophosphate-dependent acetolactate synthase large subunit-like protein [Sagittula marina]
MKDTADTLKLHQGLARALASHGTTHLYGLVGDANLFMVDAYVDAELGRYVACTHEANAVLAAIGFAQATGRTGVATITHGPALTNVITALAEAARGGIPLVVLCGDTAPGDLQHLQKIDQREVVASTGAVFIEMRSPATAIEDLDRAFRIAAHRRCPVVYNMRVDLMWNDIAATGTTVAVPDCAMAPASGEPLEDAAGMLASARRPLILAGRGAATPQARAALIALAARIEAPLATTLKAQGLFHGEPFNIGICGGLSHPTAVDVIMQSDCILAFGASLSKHTTEERAYTKGKRVVQILPDVQETPRLDTATLRLIGDLAGTATALTELLDMAEIPGSGVTDPDLAERLRTEATDFARVPTAAKTAPGTVDMAPALRRLHQALPEDRVLVADLGRFVTSAWRNLPVTRPQDLVYTSHFGAIGCGLGEAIGAATSIDDRPTVLVAGDGGFTLSGLSELVTAVREKADLIVILCNDGSYGAEHVQFTNRKMDPELSMIARIDFATTCATLGFATVRVTDDATLDTACTAIAERDGPVLIDLRLDPTMIEM